MQKNAAEYDRIYKQQNVANCTANGEPHSALFL